MRHSPAPVAHFHRQLRIALSDGITPSRLPLLLAMCRQEEPEVEIRLFEVPLSQQIKGPHDDLYDVGFAQSDDVGEGIAVEAVWSDALMVAVPARHPLLKHKRIPLGKCCAIPSCCVIRRSAKVIRVRLSAYFAVQTWSR